MYDPTAVLGIWDHNTDHYSGSYSMGHEVPEVQALV